MKLWWVHCETMVGMLLAFSVTRDPVWWRRFEKVRRGKIRLEVDRRKNIEEGEKEVKKKKKGLREGLSERNNVCWGGFPFDLLYS